MDLGTWQVFGRAAPSARSCWDAAIGCQGSGLFWHGSVDDNPRSVFIGASHRPRKRKNSGSPCQIWKLIAAGLLLLNACSRSKDAGADWQQEVDRLEKQMLPPEAIVVAPPDLTKGPQSLQAQWRFRTAWTLKRYQAWAKDHTPPGFTPQGAGAELRFSCYRDGDQEVVSITPMANGGALDVTVHFSTFPD